MNYFSVWFACRGVLRERYVTHTSKASVHNITHRQIACLVVHFGGFEVNAVLIVEAAKVLKVMAKDTSRISTSLLPASL